MGFACSAQEYVVRRSGCSKPAPISKPEASAAATGGGTAKGCMSGCIQRRHVSRVCSWGKHMPSSPLQSSSPSSSSTEEQLSISNLFSHPIHRHFHSVCFVHPKSPLGAQVNRARQVAPPTGKVDQAHRTGRVTHGIYYEILDPEWRT